MKSAQIRGLIFIIINGFNIYYYVRTDFFDKGPVAPPAIMARRNRSAGLPAFLFSFLQDSNVFNEFKPNFVCGELSFTGTKGFTSLAFVRLATSCDINLGLPPPSSYNTCCKRRTLFFIYKQRVKVSDRIWFTDNIEYSPLQTFPYVFEAML